MNMILNSNTARLRKTKGESNTSPSQTVPDQTLTIRQILERYVQGIPVDVSHREPVYNEDIEFDNVKGLDLTEIDDIKENIELKKNFLNKQKKELENEIKKREKNASDRKSNDGNPVGAIGSDNQLSDE